MYNKWDVYTSWNTQEEDDDDVYTNTHTSMHNPAKTCPKQRYYYVNWQSQIIKHNVEHTGVHNDSKTPMCIWIRTCYIWQTMANIGSVKQGTHLWDKISYTPTRPSSVPKPSHPSLLGCHANCGNKWHNTHSQFLDTVFILCYCPSSPCFLSSFPHNISVWKNPWLIQKKKIHPAEEELRRWR